MNIYAEEIRKIAIANIHKGEDIGDGTYFNFNLDSKSLHNPKYDEVAMIVQVGVGGGCENSIWLLPYYYTDEKKDFCDHDDIDFYELTESQQKELLNDFINEYMETPKKNSKNLIDYIKATTLEEKVNLINKWEEDRGADGDAVYDLDNTDDARYWLDMYGVNSLYECRAIGRYWMGGWQFSYKGINKQDGIIAECWNVNDASFETFLNNILVCDIEDRYEGYIKDNYTYQENADTIKWVTDTYGGLIDFEGYAVAKGDIKTYCQFAWITKSNDGAYEDASVCFLSKESCYNSMRDAVLEKMKWNTRYDDVIDGQGEDGNNSIGYGVHFAPNWIEHNSYSGKYIALIVRCDSEGNLEPNAWEKLDEMLKTSKYPTF